MGETGGPAGGVGDDGPIALGVVLLADGAAVGAGDLRRQAEVGIGDGAGGAVRADDGGEATVLVPGPG